LIWRCVPDEALMDEARALATRLASAATRGLALTKQAIDASYANTLQEQLALEASLMRELGASCDYREGVAAFLEKRAPNFQGK
ncbi:MAG: enoyl-CoA hydratase-related protein, partial [Gammaproteobacteria bacterium]